MPEPWNGGNSTFIHFLLLSERRPLIWKTYKIEVTNSKYCRFQLQIQSIVRSLPLISVILWTTDFSTCWHDNQASPIRRKVHFSKRKPRNVQHQCPYHCYNMNGPEKREVFILRITAFDWIIEYRSIRILKIYATPDPFWTRLCIRNSAFLK